MLIKEDERKHKEKTGREKKFVKKKRCRQDEEKMGRQGKDTGTIIEREQMTLKERKAMPHVGLTHSLCLKLGSILCHGEPEPRAGSLENSCAAVALLRENNQRRLNPYFVTLSPLYKIKE